MAAVLVVAGWVVAPSVASAAPSDRPASAAIGRLGVGRLGVGRLGVGGLGVGRLAVAAPASTATRSSPPVRPFPTRGRPDYQLGGAYRPPAGVTIVERDSTAHPAPGTYGICYVNGFQTQPQDTAWWRREHPRDLLRTASGKPVSDPGWPDEVLLDTGTAAHRRDVVRVLSRTVDRCARRGFDAVEFDNLDSWTRSRGRLSRADALATAALLVDVAHRDGLAAGQKNAPGLGTRGRDVAGFDFAVAEECVRYDECRAYTRVYGGRVIDVEYSDALRTTFAAACRSASRPRMTILRDRDLVTPSHAAYRYRRCLVAGS
ncbi:endo alpha-1,4 polygalactosaminidase [Curtobacterium sp. MCBD17_028]|uniref:endo alpha-1,4 polygalactosaminidase n=1 Tax=Curtobacterium sp. MCBD17_028 TaxID=2175670 RepID=UPI000DAA74D2|nr:endo alpha-1,4 polygalactosaminidase [Curtobacterium sp. MCBD17_028]PZE23901.1 hypothetical protein DEI86_13745 [Curtobacterium sp. MCBD17_028]